MKIRFSKHALKRLGQRRISQGQVRLTIAQPDNLYREGGLWVAERKTDRGNILRVYYAEKKDKAGPYILVVTVYRTSSWGGKRG